MILYYRGDAGEEDNRIFRELLNLRVSQSGTRGCFTEMKKRMLIAVAFVILSAAIGIVYSLLFEGNLGNDKPTASPTDRLPAATNSPTPVTTETPVIDEAMLNRLYADIFPEDSLKKTATNSYSGSFDARLEVTAEEWNRIRDVLDEDENWYIRHDSSTAQNMFAVQLFSKKEADCFVEGWDRIREVFIPEKQHAHECLEIMQGDDGQVLIYYWISVN